MKSLLALSAALTLCACQKGEADKNAPLPGANSFTEGEARSRLEKAGFKDAKDLKKDKDGIWRGTAMHGGQSVPVGLDFKGNVAAQ